MPFQRVQSMLQLLETLLLASPQRSDSNLRLANTDACLLAPLDAWPMQWQGGERTLRLIHYSAWLARRWEDPAFPAAFPWFNTQRYWQDRILELKEQISAMAEPPLSA